MSLSELVVNHTPAKILREVVLADGSYIQNHKGTPWPSHINVTKPEPPQCVVFRDGLTGQKLARSMKTGKNTYRYPVQVTSRSQTASNALTKVLAIDAFCQGLYRKYVTIDSTKYLIQNVSTTTPPTIVGTEPDSDLQMATFGCFLTLKSTT